MDMVLWTESFRIAFRQMARHRTRSVLTILGVIIGVAAIIAVVSLSEGAKRTIEGQIASLGTNMIIIMPGSTTDSGVRAGAGSAQTLTLNDADAIERECSAVSVASAVGRRNCQVVSQLANWSVLVTGGDEDYMDVRSWDLQYGRGIERRDVATAAKICVIGQTAAKNLFGQEDPIGQRIRVEGTPIRIVGLLKPKGQNPLGQDQDDVIIMPIKTILTYLISRETPQAIVASAVDEAQIDVAVDQITHLLRDRHHIRATMPDDFTVKSIEEASRTHEEISGVMRWLLVGIAGVSLLVGGIGIMNIMLVTVMERTREIGIRMALGATRRQIMRQFMIEAATMSGVGGLLGILTGLLLSILFSRVTGWPMQFTADLLLLPMLFAVAIGVLFGLLPARRAARLNPVESLRHE